jgi:hypothetical protein
MFKFIVIGAVAVTAGVLIYQALPDIKRYRQIKKM